MASYQEMRLQQLRDLCAERHIAISGKKETLVERLQKYEQKSQGRKQEDEHMSEAKHESASPIIGNASASAQQQKGQMKQQQQLKPYSIAPESAQSVMSNSPNANEQLAQHESPRPSSPPQQLKEEPTDHELFSMYSHIPSDQSSTIPLAVSANDNVRIIVDRKQSVHYQQTPRKPSPMAGVPQFYSRATNVVWGTTTPYKYEQLVDVATTRFVYNDGEIPWWLVDDYDRSSATMMRPGLGAEYIFDDRVEKLFGL